MGIIPTQDEYGDDCAACYSTGKTPNLLKAFVTGIQTGSAWLPEMGPAPNGYHDMYQDVQYPCYFGRVGQPYPCARYKAAAYPSRFWLYFATASLAFLSEARPICFNWFYNSITNPSGNYFYGGRVVIRTPEEIAAIIESYTPMIDPNPRMECFPVDGEKAVIRYAGKKDATNFNMKVDM